MESLGESDFTALRLLFDDQWRDDNCSSLPIRWSCLLERLSKVRQLLVIILLSFLSLSLSWTSDISSPKRDLKQQPFNEMSKVATICFQSCLLLLLLIGKKVFTTKQFASQQQALPNHELPFPDSNFSSRISAWKTLGAEKAGQKTFPISGKLIISRWWWIWTFSGIEDAAKKREDILSSKCRHSFINLPRIANHTVLVMGGCGGGMQAKMNW